MRYRTLAFLGLAISTSSAAADTFSQLQKLTPQQRFALWAGGDPFFNVEPAWVFGTPTDAFLGKRALLHGEPPEGDSGSDYVMQMLTTPTPRTELADGDYLVPGCWAHNCEEKAALIVRPDGSVAAIATSTPKCTSRDCDEAGSRIVLTVYLKPTADWPSLQSELWDWADKTYAQLEADEAPYETGRDPLFFPTAAETVMLPPDKGQPAAMPGLVLPVLRPAERNADGGDCAAMAANAASCADDAG